MSTLRKRGRHRRKRWAATAVRRPSRLFAWVDLRTSITHFLTPDAAAVGRQGVGRYIALCGADLIPAGMTDPGSGTCPDCTALTVPTQQNRG